MRVRPGSAVAALTVVLTVVLTAVAAGPVLPASASAVPGAAEESPPAKGNHSVPEPLPLERLFGNRAVSDDARPRAADFDGAGNSLSAADLAAAGWSPGRALGIDAARLRRPDTAPGQPDNVVAAGQQVRLTGRGDALSFLVAASSPGRPGQGASGTGTVRYSDGSASSYTLVAPDWRGGPLSTKAVALPHINSAQGQLTERARLYAVSVPVERDRQVVSVVLPRDPGPEADLHVFAVALRRTRSADWTGSWSAGTGSLKAVGPWTNRTVRLVVHTSAGGHRARIRLANTFAAVPVVIGHASLAVQNAGGGPAADGAPVPLSFGGRAGTVIPAGTQVFSDPVSLGGHRVVPADSNLLVSLHLPGTVTSAPLHTATLQRSYVTGEGRGDRTREASGSSWTEEITFWPFLTGVDVSGGPGSVVALGDSITDGVRSTTDANRRWTDVLARRLLEQRAVPRYGVLNQGISANRVLSDRYPGDGVSSVPGGVSARNRLERDVFAQTGARSVVLFLGINDARNGSGAGALVEGLRSIAQRSRDRGLRVLVATIPPCGGYRDCSAEVDERRRLINEHLRGGRGRGAFDALLDFDAVLRDPKRPQRLLPAYDSGDHMHPGDAGLRALADSISLRAL